MYRKRKSEGELRRRRRRRERRREVRGDAASPAQAPPTPAPAPPIPGTAGADPKVRVITVSGISAEKFATLTPEELKRRCGNRIYPHTRPHEFWRDDLKEGLRLLWAEFERAWSRRRGALVGRFGERDRARFTFSPPPRVRSVVVVPEGSRLATRLRLILSEAHPP